MLHFDQNLTPDLRKRYRPLAGPFRPLESTMLESLISHLTATAARITTVGTTDGVEVWRLRSECETLDQTARRLRMRKNAR